MCVRRGGGGGGGGGGVVRGEIRKERKKKKQPHTHNALFMQSINSRGKMSTSGVCGGVFFLFCFCFVSIFLLDRRNHLGIG